MIYLDADITREDIARSRGGDPFAEKPFVWKSEYLPYAMGIIALVAFIAVSKLRKKRRS